MVMRSEVWGQSVTEKMANMFCDHPGKISFLCAALALSLFTTAAQASAQESCGYQSAYAIERGSVHRQGDTLVVEVWGRASQSGWTDAKLAVVPDDTTGASISYRLIGCAPQANGSGDSPLYARAYIVANPGSVRAISVSADANAMQLHEDVGE